jgi:hypothetical protein
MKPNTFIIGAPKCGTTALASYLSEHRNAFFSKPKEPLFWSKDLGIEPHSLVPETLEQYEKLFEDADDRKHKVVAEGSTAYLRSPTAVMNILKYQPDAKFIVMLRDPTEVAYAYHMEQLFTGLEREMDFGVAWSCQPDREMAWDRDASKNSDSLLYRRIATFSPQIDRLFSLVPPGNRKVILFDTFKNDPGMVYRETLTFLGLDDDGRTSFEPKNESHAQRFPAISRFLLAPPAPLRPLVKALRMSLLRKESAVVGKIKSYLNVKRARRPLDPELLAAVRRDFVDDICKLERILECDLRAWKPQ